MNPPVKVHTDDAARLFGELREIEQMPGWKSICAGYADKLASVTAQILDPSTSDEKANELRKVRKYLLEMKPDALITTLQTKYRNVVEKATKDKTP